MAEVSDVILEVTPMYGQVQFFGDGDDYPEWGDEGIAVSAMTATFVMVPDVETYSMRLHVYDENEEISEVFYESMINIGQDGLEIAYVESSSIDCVEGVMGKFFRIPWSGKTVLKFTADEGFVEYEPGLFLPQSLGVHVMPSSAN